MANLDWTVFCSPSTEYVDKTSWVESVCHSIGGSYSAAAEEVTWLQMMFTGLKWHFIVFFGALVIALILGSLLGVMRTTPNKWLKMIGNAYVEVFRNIPLVIQYFLWLFVVPSFLPATFSADSNAEVSGLGYRQIAASFPWVMGILGLGMYHAARVSEQVRAGIQTVSTGQWNAGFALGMSRPQIYVNSVLPQAFRIVWPTLTSEMMNMFKNASVAFVVSVANFYALTKNMIGETSQVIVILAITTLIYLFFTYAIKFVMVRIEKRIQVPGMITGGK